MIISRIDMRILILFFICGFCRVLFAGPDDVRQSFSLHDTRVNFTVPADWAVYLQNTDNDGDAVIFQVKNPADEGTPDSANVVIKTYRDTNLSVEDVANFRSSYITKQPGGVLLKRQDGEEQNTDIFYQYTLHQGPTVYIGFDRIARRGDVLVHIIASWPVLEQTSEQWSATWIAETSWLFMNLSIDGQPIVITSTIREAEDNN
jgi:hypothetical protein